MTPLLRNRLAVLGTAVLLPLFSSPTAKAQLLGGVLNTVTDTVSNTVNQTQSAVNDLVSTTTGTLTSTLDSVLNTVGDVTGANLPSVSENLLPGSSTSQSLSSALDTLGTNNKVVFSQAVRDTIAANSLPASVSQRVGSFQGLGAVTRDIGGRLLQLRAGRYLGGARQKLDTEFSDDGESTMIEYDDGSYLVVYAQGDAIDLDIDNYGLARTFDARTYVGTVAIEYHPNDYQAIGIAASWTDTDLELGNNLGDADIQGGVVSAYGSWYDGPFYVDGLVAYGRLDHDLSRSALNERTAFADTDSDVFAGQISTGTHFDVGPFVTGPYLQAEYNRGEIDGYREKGSGRFDLEVEKQSSDSLTSDLGWQISLPVETADGYFAPVFRIGWGHEYLSDDSTVNARLANFRANRIRSTSVSLDDELLILSGGLVLSKTDAYTFTVEYEAEIAEDYLRQSASAMFSLPF